MSHLRSGRLPPLQLLHPGAHNAFEETSGPNAQKLAGLISSKVTRRSRFPTQHTMFNLLREMENEGSRRPTFDVDRFKARADAFMYEDFAEITRILSLRPGGRSEEDRRFLVKALATVPYFENIDEESLVRLVDVMTIVHYPALTTVVSQGEKGDTFYVIVEGEAVVSSYDSQRMDHVISNHLKSGDHFGELSLANDQPRSATVKTKSDCVCIAVQKADYELILKERHQIELARKLNTLQQATTFESFDRRIIETLAYTAVLETYPRNHVIFHEGESSEHLYIVVEGAVKVLMTAYLRHPTKGSQTARDLRPSGPVPAAGTSAYGVPTMIEAQVVGPLDYFGGEVLWTTGSMPRVTTAYAETPLTVVVLSKFDLLKRLHAEHIEDIRSHVRSALTGVQGAFYDNLEWESYRRQLVRDIVQYRSDVPHVDPFWIWSPGHKTSATAESITKEKTSSGSGVPSLPAIHSPRSARVHPTTSTRSITLDVSEETTKRNGATGENKRSGKRRVPPRALRPHRELSNQPLSGRGERRKRNFPFQLVVPTLQILRDRDGVDLLSRGSTAVSRRGGPLGFQPPVTEATTPALGVTSTMMSTTASPDAGPATTATNAGAGATTTTTTTTTTAGQHATSLGLLPHMQNLQAPANTLKLRSPKVQAHRGMQKSSLRTARIAHDILSTAR